MKIIPKEIRRKARISLTGSYFPAVMLTVSLNLLTTALAVLIQSTGLYPSTRVLNLVLYWVLYIIILLLGALLEAGLVRFLYFLCRKQPLREKWTLFYAFRSQPDTFILTYAFRYALMLLVPALLYLGLNLAAGYALGDLYASGTLSSWFLAAGISILLAVPVILLAAIPASTYSLATYVLLDHPDCSARAALRTSRLLTRGQRGRIIRLMFGFVPLYLLGIGSLGIGLLWVQPYFHTSMGEVYLELTGQTGQTGQPEQEEQEETQQTFR